MVTNKRIFLIGPMGAGKTSVGSELSRLTGLVFIDTDQLLESRMQMTAKQIIERHGEAFLRSKEAQVLSEVAEYNSAVIATGGGCILMEDNRELLKRCGNVYYLLVDPEQQLHRLATSMERGLLPEDHSQRTTFFQNMALQRKHLYESVATARIETKQREIAHVVQQIFELL